MSGKLLNRAMAHRAVAGMVCTGYSNSFALGRSPVCITPGFAAEVFNPPPILHSLVLALHVRSVFFLLLDLLF